MIACFLPESLTGHDASLREHRVTPPPLKTPFFVFHLLLESRLLSSVVASLHLLGPCAASPLPPKVARLFFAPMLRQISPFHIFEAVVQGCLLPTGSKYREVIGIATHQRRGGWPGSRRNACLFEATLISVLPPSLPILHPSSRVSSLRARLRILTAFLPQWLKKQQEEVGRKGTDSVSGPGAGPEGREQEYERLLEYPSSALSGAARGGHIEVLLLLLLFTFSTAPRSKSTRSASILVKVHQAP